MTFSYRKAFWEILRRRSLQGCVAMTLGLCFHFFGYECSRAASITLLAAKDVGLGNEAIPLTIALGSPASGMVLYLYSKSIKKYGSKLTLRVSNILCVLIMGVIALNCGALKGLSGKFAVVCFYAFREIYVSLLSSQYWAYIAGTLDRSTSSYIVSFSGIVSVASAVGGVSVEQLVEYGGVRWLLITAVLSTIGSLLCSEAALAICYDSSRHMAKRGGDGGGSRGRSSVTRSPRDNSSPVKRDGSKIDAQDSTSTSIVDKSENQILTKDLRSEEEEKEEEREAAAEEEEAECNEQQMEVDLAVDQKDDSAEQNHSNCSTRHRSQHQHQQASTQKRHHGNSCAHRDEQRVSKKREGFWIDSINLMMKHRLLQILFLEAITHQLCGNMLNLMFHNGLRSEVADNSQRARLVGRFFATVNVAACTLQCFAIPKILSQSTLPSVLCRIPFVVLVAVALGIVRPGLISVMLGFGTIKVLEYSIMHSASEMIYLPTGNDVRYLGKELIRFFGHKLGKSGASLVLSGLVSQFEPSISTQSVWGAAVTLCWAASMFILAEHLKERDQSEENKATAATTTTVVTTTTAATETVLAQKREPLKQQHPLQSSSSADIGSSNETEATASMESVVAIPAKATAAEGIESSVASSVVRARKESDGVMLHEEKLLRPVIEPCSLKESSDETSEESESPDLTLYSSSAALSHIAADSQCDTFVSSDTLGTLDSSSRFPDDDTADEMRDSFDPLDSPLGLNIDDDEEDENEEVALISTNPKPLSGKRLPSRKKSKASAAAADRATEEASMVMLRIDSTQVSLNTLTHGNAFGRRSNSSSGGNSSRLALHQKHRKTKPVNSPVD